MEHSFQKIILFYLLLSGYTQLHAQPYEPVIAQQHTVVDTFFNRFIIKDNYRWLENINSSATKGWIELQKKASEKYLPGAIEKANSFNAINIFANVQYDNPRKMGNYYFTYAFYNTLGTAVLFYQSKLKQPARVLVDPNTISRSDKIVLNGYEVSKDSKLLAYQFSRNGSDWNEVKVVSLKMGLNKKDHLTGLKFSHIAWRGNGFYYSTFAQDKQFGITHGQRIFYHTIGNEQKQDQLVYEKKFSSSVVFEYLTSSDERFFVLKEIDEANGSVNIYYTDFNEEHPVLKLLIANLKHNLDILDSHDGKFIATTRKDADNGKIVEVDPANPLQWRAITAQFADALLVKVIPFADRLVAVYQAGQHPVIMVLEYSGAALYSLELPVASAVNGFSGSSSDEELLFDFTTYTIPPMVYSFNIRTFKKELTRQTAVTFDVENIEYEEVEYMAKDSVRIPMILVYEKGLKRDGTNAAILNAYGGFGLVQPPSFDPGIVYFIKAGGVFAFANIRGGGNKGVKWAQNGRGEYKQNSFDDFISAAEFLIANKYTCKEKLAATGASNGGLVVAAAAIQRPDLFKVVVPVVAPLDMLRFEKFTVGHWWTDEYGTVNDSLSFKRLLEFSPYHNIREDINYPAMLVVTSENDDRVPPFNSYKFVARLQSRPAQLNPILLINIKFSGHYGASSLTSVIQKKADMYGFIMNEIMK